MSTQVRQSKVIYPAHAGSFQQSWEKKQASWFPAPVRLRISFPTCFLNCYSLRRSARRKRWSCEKENLRVRLFSALQASICHKFSLCCSAAPSIAFCQSNSLQVSGHFALKVDYLLFCVGKQSAERKSFWAKKSSPP